MTTSFLLAEREPSFRMPRPTLINGGFVTDIDPDVKARLDQLDELLGKRVLAKGAAATPVEREKEICELLRRPLVPWRPAAEFHKKGGWPKDSLGDVLSDAKDDPDNLSIAGHIDLTQGLSDLKYDLKARFDSAWFSMGANARAVLQDHENVQDYLVARAYHIGGLRDPKALYNYVVSNSAGVRSIVDYVAVSAGRTIVERERRKVPDYHEDGKAFSEKLKDKAVSLSSADFPAAVSAVCDDVNYNKSADELLKKANIGDIPESLRATLVSYIRNSKIPVTPTNIDILLPSFVAMATGYNLVDDSDGAEGLVADRSYDVQFVDRANAESDIDREAVHFAAQLFHSMVLGEELGVFEAFQYLLHSRMLVGGGMQVRDKALRADLRLYTLGNEFRDLKLPGQPSEERTRASERKMFARQVFAQGDGELIEGMEENVEFRQLWSVLILESARFIENARESFHPESYVSKQNVLQAVEDLQYNLSTYCVGWPQVMAPVIDAELNFVLRRFIENPSIAQQVLPTGGSWKRVIDKLNRERPKKAPVAAAALLYAKASWGRDILNAIGDYTPAAYEDDRRFGQFVGLVDAYITTESKLQRDRTAGRRKGRQEEEDEDAGAPEAELEPVERERETVAEGSDEWDF